jgi:hypothetical protein
MYNFVGHIFLLLPGKTLYYGHIIYLIKVDKTDV